MATLTGIRVFSGSGTGGNHDRNKWQPSREYAVGDDHNGIEDFLPILVVERGHSMGDPPDGVGFPGSSRMLDEIGMSHSFFF